MLVWNGLGNGRVGIGLANGVQPGVKLDLGGVAGVDGMRFPDSTVQTTAFRKIKISATIDLPSLVPGGGTTITVANVTGAAVGDAVIINPRNTTFTPTISSALVSAPDTVTINFVNARTVNIDAPATSFDITVIK